MRGLGRSAEGSLSDLVLFMGAGASSSSGLPTFNQLRGALIDQAELWRAVPPSRLKAATRRVELLAPEVFMSCLGGTVSARELWLTTVLAGGKPSEGHLLAAVCLRSGGTVWTPNADELIEMSHQRMFGEMPTAAVWPDPPQAAARLLKPHGSVTVSRFLFTSEQVVRPLAAPWADRLRADLTGRHLIVYGYAGVDLDMQPVLAEAMRAAASVSWIAPDREIGQLRARYPMLFQGQGRAVVTAPSYSGLPPLFTRLCAERGLNPPNDRLDWLPRDNLHEAAVEDTTTDTLPAAKPSRTDTPIPAPELFRARLLLRLGEHTLTVPALRQAAAQADRHSLAGIVRTLITEGAYTRSMPRVVQVLDWAADAPRLPGLRPLRRRALRPATTLHGFYDHDYEWVLAHLDGDDINEPGALNARALAHRYAGDVEQGVADAENAFRTAQHAGEPDVAANAAFQLCYLTSWAGAHRDFHQWLTELTERMSTLTSVRWLGWAHFQRARAAVHVGDSSTAFTELSTAQALLEADGTPGGTESCQVLRMTVMRLDGQPRRHSGLVERLRPAMLDGSLPQTQRMSVLLEIAERLRQWPTRGQNPGTLYAEVASTRPTRPFFTAWALAGQAVCSDDPATAPGLFRQARYTADRAGLYGVTAEIDRLEAAPTQQWWLTP